MNLFTPATKVFPKTLEKIYYKKSETHIAEKEADGQ